VAEEDNLVPQFPQHLANLDQTRDFGQIVEVRKTDDFHDGYQQMNSLAV
jgi:hypothetical protein